MKTMNHLILLVVFFFFLSLDFSFSFHPAHRHSMRHTPKLFSKKTLFDKRPLQENDSKVNQDTKNRNDREPIRAVASPSGTGKPWFKLPAIKILGNSMIILGFMTIPLAAYCEYI